MPQDPIAPISRSNITHIWTWIQIGLVAVPMIGMAYAVWDHVNDETIHLNAVEKVHLMDHIGEKGENLHLNEDDRFLLREINRRLKNVEGALHIQEDTEDGGY